MMPTSATGRLHSRGFTLLELLVVILIVVLLSAALPLAQRTALRSTQARIAAQSIAVSWAQARDAARGRGNDVTLTVSPTEFQIDDAAAVPWPEGAIAQWRSGPVESERWVRQSVVAAVADERPQRLTFFADGGATPGQLQLRWRNGKRERVATITVQPVTGRLEVGS